MALWGFTLATLGMAGLAAAPAVAAPGTLDPGFGDGGIRLFGAQTAGFELAVAMLVQPDGKVVIAGSDGTKNFLVRRLQADGTPDRSFGGDGTAAADFAGADDAVAGMALQDDGKLVVAGRSTVDFNARAAVARFTAGGTLDPSFGAGGPDGDGRVTLGADTLTDVRAVAILPGGDIALPGTTTTPYGDLGVARLREDGSPDDIAYEPVPSAEGAGRALAAARATDGKLLVAGSLYRAAAPGSAITGVARYGADGKLDRTFGTQGLATLPSVAEPHGIVPLADGGIVLAGASLDGEQSTLVARLDASGKPDAGFGGTGIVDVGFPGADLPAGISVLPDGRVLVGAKLGTDLAFGAARLEADGRPDERYGDDGIAVIPVGERALSTAAAAAPGGAFVLAGPAVLPGLVSKLAVARLQADPPPAGDPSPGAGDPDPQPAADIQPPVVNGLHVSRRVAGARPRIRFTLSEPARVRVTLKRRHRRATTISVDAGAGANRLRGPRRLVRGRYRLTAVAVDGAGNAAAPVRVRFNVRAA
jgi:uncharacterized delta-60 repeat protein